MRTIDEFLAYARGYWAGVAAVPGAITPGPQWDVADRDAGVLLKHAGEGKTVLDFGCGEGRLARQIASRFERYIGVDVTPVCIQRARNLGIQNAEFQLLTSVNDIPKVDVIVAFTVFMHFPSWVLWSLVKHLREKLNDGGRLIFQLNDSDVLSGNEEAHTHRYDMVPDDELWEGRRYPHKLVRERMDEYGFHMIHGAESAYDAWAFSKFNE